LIQTLKKRVGREKSFEVTSIQVHLQGYCAQCQGKNFFRIDNCK
jgi:Fe2+ or Zn2+ uptake regulation protein